MTANKTHGAPEDILTILHADTALIEEDYHLLPLSDIKEKLVELGLSPCMPADLKYAISASTSPAVEVLAFLKEDEEAFGSIEERPLPQVTGRLQELGVNYQSGTKKIMDLVKQAANCMASIASFAASKDELEYPFKSDRDAFVHDWEVIGQDLECVLKGHWARNISIGRSDNDESDG